MTALRVPLTKQKPHHDGGAFFGLSVDAAPLHQENLHHDRVRCNRQARTASTTRVMAVSGNTKPVSAALN